MDLDQAVVYIYALCEPDGETVRYIGQAIYPAARLAGHVSEARSGRGNPAKNAWISALLERGQRPCLLVLETSTESLAQQAEYRLIAAYAAQGANLVNMARRSVRPKGRRARGDAHAGVVGDQDSPPWGQRLRALREQRSLSQAELADLVGTSQSQISQWEQGPHVPQAWHRRRLAEALGVSAYELANGLWDKGLGVEPAQLAGEQDQ